MSFEGSAWTLIPYCNVVTKQRHLIYILSAKMWFTSVKTFITINKEIQISCESCKSKVLILVFHHRCVFLIFFFFLFQRIGSHSTFIKISITNFDDLEELPFFVNSNELLFETNKKQYTESLVMMRRFGSSLDGFYDCFYFIINSIPFGIKLSLIEMIAMELNR